MYQHGMMMMMIIIIIITIIVSARPGAVHSIVLLKLAWVALHNDQDNSEKQWRKRQHEKSNYKKGRVLRP